MTDRLRAFYDHLVLDRPWAVLVFLVAVVVAMVTQAGNFRLDASSDSLLLEGDEDLRYYRKVLEQYGTRDFLFVTYNPDAPMLDPATLERHIAWDIGAAAVADILSGRFDATLVKSGYSRLVVDCNRDLADETSIPQVSDGVPIPGNRTLTGAEAAARAGQIMLPYHAEIERLLDEDRDPPLHAFVSVHSFTPVFDGLPRPWQVAALWNRDGRLALPFMAALTARGDVTVGDNQPYSARNNFGYTVHRHGELRDLPHLLVEIRQDLIADGDGVIRWAAIVGDALRAAFDSLPP